MVIIEDIVTTGLSIRETVESLRALGAEMLAAGCLIGRQGRSRRAVDCARRIRGSGLSGRQIAAGIGCDTGVQTGKPQPLSVSRRRIRLDAVFADNYFFIGYHALRIARYAWIDEHVAGTT